MVGHAETRNLELKQLTLTEECHQRTTFDVNTVQHYAALLASGTKLPPLRVVSDGSTSWLWDGFHTYHALKSAGIKQYPCEITKGDFRHAVWLSCGANRQHGLVRTSDDIRKQIDTLLRDPEFGTKSVREIAKHLDVSHMTVQRRRDYWRDKAEAKKQKAHWSLHGTEPEIQEQIDVHRPILPTTFTANDKPIFTNGKLSLLAVRRKLNRDCRARLSSAARSISTAMKCLNAITKTKPIAKANDMNMALGRIQTQLAKLVASTELLYPEL